jgi:hypothetical protein
MVHVPKQTDLLAAVKSRHNQLNSFPFYDPRYSHHFPPFGFGTVSMMLRDARISFGLGMIKGPIYSYTKFFTAKESEDLEINQAIIEMEYHYAYKVEAASPDTEKFVIENLNKFWEDGLMKALQCLEWGFSPNQVIYKRDEFTGNIIYNTLDYYSPIHCRPVSKNNELVGVFIRQTNKFIPLPKSCSFVHQREKNNFTGQSRLLGCHIPWHETWQLGGARDIRRLWYYKCAYDAGTLYFPNGSVTDEFGNTKDNAEIAVELMEATQTGSYRVLPKPEGSKNDKTWDFEAPKANTTPDGILEYPQDLRCEVLEGLGIPREVVEANGSSGFGSSSGRNIPRMAFIASLCSIVSETLTDFDKQILRPLVKINGLNPRYKLSRIIPKRPLKIDNENPSNVSAPSQSAT